MGRAGVLKLFNDKEHACFEDTRNPRVNALEDNLITVLTQ